MYVHVYNMHVRNFTCYACLLLLSKYALTLNECLQSSLNSVFSKTSKNNSFSHSSLTVFPECSDVVSDCVLFFFAQALNSVLQFSTKHTGVKPSPQTVYH